MYILWVAWPSTELTVPARLIHMNTQRPFETVGRHPQFDVNLT